MENITIRQAESRDAEAIAGFNIAMAEETEGRPIARDLALAGVKSLFERPAHGFYLVADAGEEIAGSLLVTHEWSDWRNGVFYWIQSVYVKPAFRRKGIYARLYAFLKTMAQVRKDVCGFRLYVEKDNTGAQKTYEKLGMTKTRYLMYEEGL
jgi:ribosomal protein S18 acetylase RimI-like enzyme